LKKS
ncbi:hypothetical protein D018_1427B, partial [Vibrio parahaemolyticus VP2007-007]|jgi:hypothetical protein